MTEGILTKETAKKLMEMKGECRGENFKINLDYAIERKGGEGLRMVEDRMAELGYPLRYKEIKPMNYYPIGLDAISMLAIKDIFNLDDKGMEEMGASTIKFSLLAKIFFTYFISLEMISKELPKMWPRHYTLGTLVMPEYDSDKRYAIIRLKDFSLHPALCTVYKGYFRKATEILLKAKVIIEETKCPFRGGDYHEFLIKW